MKKNEGFTLVETIIYIGIIGAVIHGFVSFAIFTAVSNAKTIAVSEVQANSQIVLDHLTRKIREANDVVSPSSGNNADSLELAYSSSPNIVFEELDEILYASSNQLTDSSVSVSDLSFHHLGEESNKSNIVFEYTITYSNDLSFDYNYSQTIKSSATLRN